MRYRAKGDSTCRFQAAQRLVTDEFLSTTGNGKLPDYPAGATMLGRQKAYRNEIRLLKAVRCSYFLSWTTRKHRFPERSISSFLDFTGWHDNCSHPADDSAPLDRKRSTRKLNRVVLAKCGCMLRPAKVHGYFTCGSSWSTTAGEGRGAWFWLCSYTAWWFRFRD